MVTPARVRFTSFLARHYRARSFTLAHVDEWWVCEIDDTAHAAHTALGALKGWFEIWT